MKIRQQLSIRRLLISIVVAAVLIKLSEWVGIVDALRNQFLSSESGNSTSSFLFIFAVVIWICYAFLIGVVLPGSFERYLQNRKLRIKRYESKRDALKEMEGALEEIETYGKRQKNKIS